MTADTLARLRITVFALAGLTCLSYGLLALIGDTARPFSPWLPGASSYAAGVVMWVSSAVAGGRAAGIAHDELFWVEWGHTVKFSYWFAIAMYPLFGILMALDLVSISTSLAAMGTASGAAPLLTFCLITLRS